MCLISDLLPLPEEVRDAIALMSVLAATQIFTFCKKI